MADTVKSTRRYESPRRREQAAATRQQILEAAQRLFERQGYAATTMAAIAAEACVAPKTVYLAFETKSGVLRALWHLLLRGDQADTPMPQRAWYQAVLDEPDAARQMRLIARNSRMVKLRAGGLLKVIRSAATLDGDIATLWERIQAEFYEIHLPMVELMSARRALRPELDVTTAADILWTINHPDVWHLLVGERHWTPERYEQWCVDTSCAQLLAPVGL